MKLESLTRPRLREIRLEAIRGKLPDPAVVEVMAEALEDALDAASCSEEVDAPEDVSGIYDAVKGIEAAREKAVSEEVEAEKAHERKVEELEADHARFLEEEREKRLEMEKDLDDWRRRAERAEHDLAAGVRSGHGLDRAAAEQVRKANLELAEMRSNLELALSRRAEAEKEARETRETNARLQAQMDRGADWWREQARAEITVALSAEIDARLAAEKAREAASRETWRLREALSAIVDGAPAEAWQKARVVLGREIIRESGTEAREAYVPTRAERRRARGK